MAGWRPISAKFMFSFVWMCCALLSRQRALLKKKATPTNEEAERQTLCDAQSSAPISTKALCQNGAE
jgi:hypothetical protein